MGGAAASRGCVNTERRQSGLEGVDSKMQATDRAVLKCLLTAGFAPLGVAPWRLSPLVLGSVAASSGRPTQGPWVRDTRHGGHLHFQPLLPPGL